MIREIFQLHKNKSRKANYFSCKNIELSIKDIVFVYMSGKAEKNKKPSSEWRFHLDLYKSRKCNAIVHATKYSVICSCLFKEIPSFHYMTYFRIQSPLKYLNMNYLQQ